MRNETAKLLCFDYDRTMTECHVYNTLHPLTNGNKAHPDILEMLKGISGEKGENIKNKDELLRIFQTALKNGHKIAITSRNDFKGVIEETLRILGLTPEEIDQIKIIASFRQEDRIEQVKEAMKAHGFEDKSAVYLIDDDINNCVNAIENGYNAIPVPAVQPVQFSSQYVENAENYGKLFKAPSPIGCFINFPLVQALEKHKASCSSCNYIEELDKLIGPVKLSHVERLEAKSVALQIAHPSPAVPGF